MFIEIKRLFKHSLIYLFGSGLQSLIGFILIPLYTRTLSPADYGKLEILNTVLLILNMIFSFGFASALLKVHERDCRNLTEQKTLIGTLYLFVLPAASLLTLVVVLGGRPLAHALLGGDTLTTYTHYLYLILATNLVTVFLNLSFAVLRAKEQSKRFTWFSLVKFSLILALNVYFVVERRWGIGGILWGNFLAAAALIFFFLPTLRRYLRLAFSYRLWHKLAIFGFAIIPASLAMWIMDLSDRYFLKHFADFTTVGLYSLGYKIGYLVYILLVVPFQLAWPKISFALAERADCRKIYAQALTYFTLIGCALALTLTIFGAQFIKLLAAPQFATAEQVIPWIAFAYVLYGGHFIMVTGLHLREKSKYYPLMIALPAAVNLLLNYYFIPRYGMTGAAVTTLVCFILVIILTYVITQAFYRVAYEWQRLAKILGAAAVVLTLNYLYPLTDLSLLAFLHHGALLALFLLIIFLIKFISPLEMRLIKEKLLNQKLRP